MSTRRGYYPGDYLVICDRTGYKVHASQTRKEWNGLRVMKEVYEDRHPQDQIKARPDTQRVPDPRPEPDDNFLTDNEVTADSL